jgi:hypothetical protein
MTGPGYVGDDPPSIVGYVTTDVMQHDGHFTMPSLDGSVKI